eukprot:GHVS01036659.1.p1 GENE.GHVS01036659.1~~GHVS01036659.1.p1  ORF type:complete len:385 (+),score=34.13 GHVS01036659.1:49-1155(+)
MVLVFSLQPNEINAITSLCPEFQPFIDVLVKYTGESKLLSDCSEIYWLFSNNGALGEIESLISTLRYTIPDVFVENGLGAAASIENIRFIGPADGSNEENDIVRLALTDGNECSVDVDVDVGPRLMGGPGARKDLFKHLHPILFAECPVRKQMIAFAYRLRGKKVLKYDQANLEKFWGIDQQKEARSIVESFANIVDASPLMKFKFKNRLDVEIPWSDGTCLLFEGQDGTLIQLHRMLAHFANEENGTLGAVSVEELGNPLKVEEFSEEQDKLFDDFQKELLANVERTWGATARHAQQNGLLHIWSLYRGEVTTFFNPKGTYDKFTVVTNCIGAFEEANHLVLSVKSMVSRDQDRQRSLVLIHELYIV